MSWSAYWCPKAGTPPSEWEDGCAYSPSTGWFAVADGASSGVRSREWAFHLTRDFIAAGRAGNLAQLEADRFVAWTEEAADCFDPEAEEFNRFDVAAWIREASARRGAFATFLGGRVDTCGWRAVAVGDCCLFHIGAGDAVVTAFPLPFGYDGSAAPMLVGSANRGGSQLEAHVRTAGGLWEPGDCFLVATDALAVWLLGQPRDGPAWSSLRRIGNEGFQQACRDLRAAEALKNDDITLLRFVAPEAP